MNKKKLNKIDKEITQWMKELSVPFLRYSLATIFIWFGILKSFNISPAQELVANTVYWFDPAWFVPFLGWWEVLIGICFLYKPLIRIGIPLLLLQMLGTFLPLLILPSVIYGDVPYSLTLEGQYIIKNIVIIASALVVGSHVRDKN